VPRTVIFTRAPPPPPAQPVHSDSCGPLRKKGWRPLFYVVLGRSAGETCAVRSEARDAEYAFVNVEG
jgi:hypothetical protein